MAIGRRQWWQLLIDSAQRNWGSCSPPGDVERSLAERTYVDAYARLDRHIAEAAMAADELARGRTEVWMDPPGDVQEQTTPYRQLVLFLQHRDWRRWLSVDQGGDAAGADQHQAVMLALSERLKRAHRSPGLDDQMGLGIGVDD